MEDDADPRKRREVLAYFGLTDRSKGFSSNGRIESDSQRVRLS